MNEYEIKEEARLYAIEYMVMNMYTRMYRLMRTSPEAILASHQQMREMMRVETFPGFDAAEGDLVASEIQNGVENLLSGIEEMLGMGKTKGRP